MLISVIVTTYNRPKALDRVLDALSEQDDASYEVIVGDDGSREETRALVERWKERYPVRLEHAWQEDVGFRLARVRNLAALMAKGDYLIFLDGDCVPRKHWVSRHRALAERGWVVAGNRTLVSEAFTKRVEEERLRLQDLTLLQCLKLARDKSINRALPLFTMPVPFRKAWGNRWGRLRGCNFGLYKEDLLAVNGFDGLYKGWGLEDSDFAIRIINRGGGIKAGKFATGVFHLYHPENSRSCRDANYERMMQRLRNHSTRAEDGISELEGSADAPASE